MQLTSRDDPEHGGEGRRDGGGEGRRDGGHDNAVCSPAALTYRRIFYLNIVCASGPGLVPGHFMIVMTRRLFSFEHVFPQNALGKTVVSMDQRLTWLREASLGVNRLYGICKIIYRDLKPPNLMLDEDLHIKVADFVFREYLRKQAGLKYMTAPKGRSSTSCWRL